MNSPQRPAPEDMDVKRAAQAMADSVGHVDGTVQGAAAAMAAATDYLSDDVKPD